MGLSLLLLLVSTYLVLHSAESTCALTANLLWRFVGGSVFLSWTLILAGALCMIIATTAVLSSPSFKSSNHAGPVRGHKFKTYYGTL